MYYAYKQEPGESNAKHLRNFKSIVAAVEHLGGAMFADDALITLKEKIDSKAGENTKTRAYYKNIVKDKMMGVAFTKRADQLRYAKLITSIRDQHFLRRMSTQSRCTKHMNYWKTIVQRKRGGTTTGMQADSG